MRKLLQRTSLLRALKGPPIISSQDIKNLVKQEYENPVISLYMQLGPQKVVPKEKAPLRTFHSMRRVATDKHKDLIKGLSCEQRQIFAHDMQEIEAFMAEYFIPENLRSLIIFKSGEQLNRIIRLPVRAADILVIDPDPYIVPLEEVLEENEKVLLVEVTKEESHFTTYHLGYCQDAGRIQSFVPSDTVDASVPGKAQRHRLAHLQRHLKDTAERSYHLCGERGCEVLILMGENRILHMLESFLHDSLKKKIISRVYNSPDADTRDRKDLIESGLRSYKADCEESAINQLSDYKPGDELISGLQDVINASNLFFVRKLLVGEGNHRDGFVCKEHHYLSLEEAQCPFCGKRVVSVDNVVDELVGISRLHGVGITIIEYKQDLLAKYDGIAAVVYAHASQVA